MSVTFPIPVEEQLFVFIVESNKLAQVPISLADIFTTLRKEEIHPGAAGHLIAIQYAMKLASSDLWPTNNKIQFSNELESDKNLHWLRKLHEAIMKSWTTIKFTNRPDFDSHLFPSKDLAVYRLGPKSMLDGNTGTVRSLPKAASLKRCLHHWYSQMATVHMKYKDKLQSGNLTMQDVSFLSSQANELTLQFLSIQPFSEANGRVARLLENMLRLRWGLAWKTVMHKDVLSYIADINKYEDSSQWLQLKQQLQTN